MSFASSGSKEWMAWVDRMEGCRDVPAARQAAIDHLLMGVAPAS